MYQCRVRVRSIPLSGGSNFYYFAFFIRLCASQRILYPYCMLRLARPGAADLASCTVSHSWQYDLAVFDGNVVSARRARLLCNATTTPVPLGTLPVLTRSNHDAFPEWHRYMHLVYKQQQVKHPIDLNRFTWFYWFAPLRVERLFMASWNDSVPEVPYGTPWIGGDHAWHWGPEHLARRLGFFVHRRRRSPEYFSAAARLEVMRTRTRWTAKSEGKHGVAWFYHAVGSGIFLETSSLASTSLELWNEREPSMSAPRAEIKAEHGDLARYWSPRVKFSLGNSEPCASVSERSGVLSCANLDVPIWDGSERRTDCAARSSNWACARSFS